MKKKGAIWFSERTGKTVDLNRSKYYCDKFKLNYNESPYIVITQKRPDESKERDEIVVVKLSNITTYRVVKILNLLEQDLRNNKKLHQRNLLFEEVKQSLLTTAEKFNLKGMVVGLFGKK